MTKWILKKIFLNENDYYSKLLYTIFYKKKNQNEKIKRSWHHFLQQFILKTDFKMFITVEKT